MYAWEKFFARIVAERRAAEVDSIRRVTRFRALNMALFFSYQYFIAFATFTVVWIIDPSGRRRRGCLGGVGFGVSAFGVG